MFLDLLNYCTGIWPISPMQKENLKEETLMELKDMKVFIDPGHGGSDAGAVAGTTLEKDINLYVAKKLRSILSSWGVPTKMTRTGDTKVETKEIAGISNDWGADIFVSIHCNAGGGDGGTETFTTIADTLSSQ